MKVDFGITRGRNIHLWPVVYIDKTESEKRIQIAASLFNYKRNLLNNDLHTHLLPAYAYTSTTENKDIRLGSIYYPSLYRYSENFSSKIKSYKVLEIVPNIDLLEYTSSPDGDYLKNNLLFFLWYKNDKITDKSHFVLFPLYYYYRNKHESTSVLFPLFSHKKQQTRNSTWVFPTFFWKHHFYGSGNLLEEKRFTAFPIYFRNRTHENKTDVLFPLIWHYENPESHSFAFMPFYGYGENTKEQKTFYGITPLIWNITKPHYNFHFAFPVYWKKNQTFSNDTSKSTVLFPLYFRHKRSRSFPSYYGSYDSLAKKDSNHFYANNTTLFPIYWNEHTSNYFKGKVTSSNDYFAIMPFYGKGKRLRAWDTTVTSYSNITPLYWQSSSIKFSKKMLFPIMWYNHDFDSINPENHFVIFPLWWHYRSDYTYTDHHFSSRSDVLFPLYWNIDRSSSHTRTFLPLFHYWHDDLTKNYSLYTFPVYLSFKRSTSEQRFVFPLYHSYKSQYYRSTTLFPLISFGKDVYNHNNHFVLTPLFWHFDNNRQKTNFLFPIYYHSLTYFTNTQRDYFGLILYQHIKTDTTVSHRIIWPIVAYDRSPSSYSFHIAPLFWINKNATRSSFGLLPFYYQSKTQEMNSYHFLWQGFVYRNIPGIYHRYNFLGPLFSQVNFANHDHDTRLLYLLFADSKVMGNVTKSVFPLYFHKHDSVGNYSTSVGLAFYNSFKRKIEGTNFFYKEKRIFWFMRLRSNASFLKEKGIEVDRKKLRSNS